MALPEVTLRLMKEGKRIHHRDLTLLASDPSPSVIESAQTGIYPKVKASYLEGDFEQQEETFATKDEVRRSSPSPTAI